MLFDANASLGQWPFRAHPTHTAEELLARYDAIGVQRALVGSLNAVCYRDCQAGNDELLAAVAPHRERLVPVAVLNPTYAGWEADLDTCCAQGCRGVRLYPNYHRYDLTGPDARRLIEAAMERDLVLCFVCRHEDRRQRHWLDVPEDLTLTDLADGLRPFPAARFLILEGLGVEGSPFVRETAWRERRFGLDLSRMTSVLGRSIPKLAELLGPDKLVFGTGLPLKGPGPALLKLRLLDDAWQAAMGAANLERLLTSK